MQKDIRLEVINSNTKGKNNMKACIYIRVSTQKQNFSGLGQQAQRDICMNYIERTGKEFSTEFSDIESGKSRTREGLLRAVDYCKENECELVFAKLDRLARDVEFTFRVINSGVQVHFCDMPTLNTLILGVMASVAQYERELISQRTKAALKAKKERDGQTGGTAENWGSKNGNKDRITATKKAAAISSENRRGKARENANNRAYFEFITDWQAIHGRITANTDWEIISDELNRRGKKTSTGLSFDKKRARAMYVSLLNIYSYE